MLIGCSTNHLTLDFLIKFCNLGTLCRNISFRKSTKKNKYFLFQNGSLVMFLKGRYCNCISFNFSFKPIFSYIQQITYKKIKIIFLDNSIKILSSLLRINRWDWSSIEKSRSLTTRYISTHRKQNNLSQYINYITVVSS